MKKKIEITRRNKSNTFTASKMDFCWIFLPNGDFISVHDEVDYSQYLHEHYTSKSNQGL